MTPEPGWNEKEAQTVEWLCMSSFQLLVFPRRRKAGPERLNLGIPWLTADQRQDWGNDAHCPTSGPGPWSCLDLEMCWCPGHSGLQGCPREPESLSGGGGGWYGGGQGTRNGVVGGRGTKLSALHTVDPGQAPTNLPAFPCAGVEGKRCWNGEERGWPWGGCVGAPPWLNGKSSPR